MAETKQKRGLGRGLSALFGEETQDYPALDRAPAVRALPIGVLRPGRYQPRRRFDGEAISALVDSVKEKGILQPLVVRPHPDETGMYEIVAGERRWRAAQGAKLHEVPVVVRELADREALELALVENLQREDLGPLEEADAYRRLMDEFDHTQDELAKALGKSRSHVANMLRLLGLPEEVKEMVETGRVSAGHARALIGAADPVTLAERVHREGLNVRQTEELAQSAKPASARRKPQPKPEKDADTASLERDLENLLGLKVEIDFAGRGGSLTIHYRTLDQLDDVLRRLNGQPAKA
jgi:ParB family chromosome partitioning protein